MNGFWSNFWPGFAATVTGILLGVPAALWTSRRIEERARRRQRREEERRLDAALRSMEHALSENAATLGALRDTLERTPLPPLSLDLRIAAWNVVRGELVQHLRDPALQGRLASYFEDLDRLARLHAMMLDTVVGVASAISGVEETRFRLRETIVKRTAALLTETDALRETLRTRLGLEEQGS